MEPVGRTVGILGGGQLGRMLALAARPLGVRTVVVDPNPACPAGVAADEHIVGYFTDAAVIAQLARQCDVVTIEIEHINADALVDVMKAGVPVEPAPSTVALIKDKFTQKQRMAGAGVACGAFRAVATQEELAAVAQEYGYPLMLKSRREAYDGRGNAKVTSAADIPSAWGKLAPKGELYAEKWVPYVRELAVVVVRDRSGVTVAYPAVETVQRDSICSLVIAPAGVPGDVRTAAEDLAKAAVGHLDGAGVYGVELFELADGSVLLNEIAPRVHNSGHFTIEGSCTSQFENHIRAVLGLPLGSTAMRAPAATMINVLGTAPTAEDVAAAGGDKEAAAARATWAPMKRALFTPGASLHWYDKHLPADGSKGTVSIKAGRKMGHITVTGESAMIVAQRVKSILGLGANSTSNSDDDATALRALSSHAPLVGIIMGSDSDLPGMAAAAETLKQFGVPFELTIVSAHRTPSRMFDYARSARARGLQVIIAAAGGAAHLPGMVAALTPLPVIGVPMPLTYLDGVDSLYSIVQMPKGVPCATVAIGNSTNAALLAVRILGSRMPHLCDAMEAYQTKMEEEVLGKVSAIKLQGYEGFLAAKAAAAAAANKK